jgi:hypothetical protein
MPHIIISCPSQLCRKPGFGTPMPKNAVLRDGTPRHRRSEGAMRLTMQLEHGLAADRESRFSRESPQRVRRVRQWDGPAALLNAPTPQDKADDPDPTRAHQCPYCGGRMIIIETFQRGCSPRYRPTDSTSEIRIDTS